VSRRWWAPAAAAVAGVAVALAGAAQDGSGALWSGLLGAALVVGFLGSGLLPFAAASAMGGSASLGAGVLLLNYTLRLALAVAVLRVAGRSDAVEPRWTAGAVVAAAFAWTAAQAVAVLRRGPAADGQGVHDPAGHGLSGGSL
jgi:hypothetical protein